jgi:hypothetical protein
MGKKKSGILIVMLCALLLSSCATSQGTYEGGAAGGVLGAAAGALIDEHNRWRGAVIGGATYQSNDGWQKVEATPVAYNARTKCHKVREKIWQDGQLVKDTVKEVCKGDKTEYTY